MKAFIYKTSENQYLGFIINFSETNEPLLYLNTIPHSFDDTITILKKYVNENEIEDKNIPEYIIDWAGKVVSIRQGMDQDTSKIPLDYSDYTPKQKMIVKFCIENIPVNEIYPYSKVAELAGLPKAQRFVGTTMKTLRQPYIVPVHRVKSIKAIKKRSSKVRRKMPL